MAEELRAALGESNYGTWFDQVEPVSLEGSTIVLATPIVRLQ